MSAVAFDTLKLARALRDKGRFTPEQAEGVADALSEAFRDDIATKDDVAREASSIRAELASEASSIRAELASEASSIRADLAREIAGVRADMKLMETSIRGEIVQLEQRMTIKLGGMMVVAVTMVAALVKLL
ncbi:MAG TPA: coiled-coil domain-containing protein [Azospirillaceae bacterium]|nr:coiled-coil domain-containing protein [Azospirillaceae bacterium]